MSEERRCSMTRFLTPAEAAEELGISRATITRCVQKGAPVHRWGSCGRSYRIVAEEFISWMEAQGPGAQTARRQELSLEQMRMRRH